MPVNKVGNLIDQRPLSNDRMAGRRVIDAGGLVHETHNIPMELGDRLINQNNVMEVEDDKGQFQ